MNLKIIAGGILLTVFCAQACASSTWVDNRYAHITAVERNQYKIGVGHEFDSGAVILASSIYEMGKNFNQFKSSFQEYEGWYPVTLTDRLTLLPGALVDTDSDGTKVGGSAMIDYRLAEGLSAGGRYRYNHMTYKQRNLNQDMAYNDAHLIDLFVNYQATDKLWLQFNPQYTVNAGDFNSANGHKTHWETSLVAQYRLNKRWMPYTELAWLDQDQNNDNQFRLRIGIKYFLP
ncbi:oligogalacturonate-specific porin KdgM family protein [Enterobacter hormaechei]|uniref:oligogalacturonate-specific porin KdgM family protein n=1 Tax=Enterobacter hormaechei TaxID=158836 RepID=UPI002161E743|nr:oligogalacturonate-specific porin KdgM family protein [Enterobacter hormaechei]MCS0522645.1 porin [Enterobacter hormaechei]